MAAIPELQSPSVTTLNAQDVFGDKGRGGAQRGGGSFGATLDVTIDMPNKVYVQGRGLDSEWAGKIGRHN